MADLVANGRSETAVLDVAALARLVRHAAAAAARALRPLRPVRPARRILKKKKTKEIIFSVSHRFLGRFFCYGDLFPTGSNVLFFFPQQSNQPD